MLSIKSLLTCTPLFFIIATSDVIIYMLKIHPFRASLRNTAIVTNQCARVISYDAIGVICNIS